MEKYTQDNTLLSIDTPLGKDKLLLIEVSGNEAMALGFKFKLIVATQPGMTDFNKDDVLANMVDFKIQPPNQPARYFNGHCVTITNIDTVSDTQHLYELETISWFEMMKFSSDCRIFQNKSAIDIFTSICDENGLSDYDLSRLKLKHRSIPFCVQYNESYYVFLRRLLEREGIGFYFRFEDGRHIMVLVDQRSKKIALDDELLWRPGTHDRRPHLWDWVSSQGTMSTSHASRSSDFYNATTQQPVDATITNLSASTKSGAKNKENFSYPGNFTNVSDGQQFIYCQMLAEQIHKNFCSSGSSVLALAPYHAFKVAEPAPTIIGKGQYYVLEVDHRAVDCTNLYRKELLKKAPDPEKLETHYTNYFRCVPFSQDYAPPLDTAVPKIYSVQSAIVQGNKKGEPYVDKFGRIKIKFVWDRSDKTTTASFWVRIAINVSGHQFLPRAGSEVWVEFLKGNPDSPIVIGNADNAEHMPVYDIKTEKNKSGIRSRTVGSDDINDGNELQFDDTPGAEKLRLSSSNDIMINVEGDESHRIKNNHLEKVKGISNRYVYGSATYVAKKSLTLQAELGSIKLTPNKIEIKGIRVSFDESNSVDSMPDFPSSEQLAKAQMKATAPINPAQSMSGDPTSSATTTSSMDAVDDDGNPNEIVELVYATGTRTFHALTAAEVKAFNASEKELFDPINALVQANKNTSDQKKEKVEKAKKDLNKKIEALTDGEGVEAITEVVRFKAGRYTYVNSKILKKNHRTCKIDNEMKARSIMKENGKGIDLKKLKNNIQKSGSAELYAHDWSGSLGAWADRMNKDGDLSATLIGNKNDPHEHFEASAGAQLMRYTAGVSVTGGYDPKTGSFSLNASGKAELALFEGKVSASAYIPDKAGFELIIPKQPSPYSTQPISQTSENINLGAIRAEFDFGLTAFAGASVMAGVSANFGVSSTKNEKGEDVSQLQVKGTNTRKNRKGQKIVAGVNAFAGAKLGCEVGLKIAWMNPEPKKGASSDDPEWSEFAEISAEGDAALGVGYEGHFEIRYSRGKFVVRGDGGFVCGFGVSGSIGAVVYADHILSFVQYVFHKIMSQDFAYIGFIGDIAFNVLLNLQCRFILEAFHSLEELIEKEMPTLELWWAEEMLKLEGTDKPLDHLESYVYTINHHSDRLKFALPETKGRLLCLFTDQNLLDRIYKQISDVYHPLPVQPLNKSHEYDKLPFPMDAAMNMAQLQLEKTQQAIVKVLSYIQSESEFINVLQHMTKQGTKSDLPIEKLADQLYNGLGEYGRYLAKHIPHINELVEELKNRNVYPATAADKINKPVQPNEKVLAYGGR